MKNLLSLLLVVAAASGCYATADGQLVATAPTAEVVVETPPPAPVVETEVTVVRPGYVWIGGHHVYERGQYVWRRGYYERERSGHYWVAGHWDRRGRGHVWIEGHWARR